MSIIGNGLKRSIAAEHKAADDYRMRADIAKRQGDLVTAKLYLHIAREEMVHAAEFRARFNRIMA